MPEFNLDIAIIIVIIILAVILKKFSFLAKLAIKTVIFSFVIYFILKYLQVI